MATIQFENGTKVNFDGTPTQQDVEEVANKLGLKGTTSAPQNPVESNANDFSQKYKDFGVGAWKGLGRSAVNVLQGATKLFSPVGISGVTTNPVVNQTLDSATQVLQPKNTSQKLGGYAETALEIAAPFAAETKLAGKGLIKAAQDIYMSAMKPSTTLSIPERTQIVKTGLEEGIRLTENGVNKLNTTVDTLEQKLTSYIDAAKDKGGRIMTSTLKPMVEEAKTVFGNTVNVAESELNIQKIDKLYTDFVAKHGESVGVKEAQQLKTNTYQILRKSFGELGSAVQEGMKGMARGLKEGIIKEAPQVEGVNQRLSKLYQFSDALEKSVKRIGNQNIISLGGKVLMSGEGLTNKILAGVQELFKAGGKSTVSILMNKLGQKLAPEEASQFQKILQKFALPTGAIDLNNLIQYFKNQAKPPTNGQ